jgi:protein-L-isoaspartate O-methyltransferase
MQIPPALLKQLGKGKKLIAPLIEHGIQNLVLLEKSEAQKQINIRGANICFGLLHK